MTAKERAALRQRIEARLAALDEIAESSHDATAAVELDQARMGRLSRMDAMQQQAMARATDARRGAEVRRLRAALRRIDDADFGECDDCGEPIPLARLAIDPGARTCVHCAD